jgi:hypothetical protein
MEQTCLPSKDGAGNEVRTRDIKLGKLALYQLSYARISRGNISTPIQFVNNPFPLRKQASLL